MPDSIPFRRCAGGWASPWLRSRNSTCPFEQVTTSSLEALKAFAAYQDFFTVWKDADVDLPILKSARAEYERLQK